MGFSRDLCEERARWVRYCRVLLVMALGGLCSSRARPAHSHERDFPFTYDWMQPSQGEKEIELQSRYRTDGSSFEQQLEFEYGISSRFMVAPYVVFNRQRDDSLRYSAFKIEARYQPGSYATGKILPGFYAEYEKPSGEHGEVEGKIILSRYDRAGGDLSVNLITERALESDARSRYTYSFGYARPLSSGRYRARLGVEAVRDIDDGRVNAGPTLAFSPASKTWAVVGYGFPVNQAGRNSGVLRFLLEYEWH